MIIGRISHFRAPYGAQRAPVARESVASAVEKLNLISLENFTGKFAWIGRRWFATWRGRSWIMGIVMQPACHVRAHERATPLFRLLPCIFRLSHPIRGGKLASVGSPRKATGGPF